MLRRLRAESDEKNAAQAADEERKQLLLRIATVGVSFLDFYYTFMVFCSRPRAHLLLLTSITHCSLQREEVARETAERRASTINTAVITPKETPVVPTALARKASMVSLGAIPITQGLVRRQSQSVLTLDQLLFSSVAPAGAPSSEANTSGGQEPSFPAARNSKARKRNVPLPQKVDVSASVAYTGKRRGSDCSITSTGGNYNFAERNSTPLEALLEKDRGDDEAEDVLGNIGADKMSKWNHEGQDP